MLALIAHLPAQRREIPTVANLRGVTVHYPLPGSVFPPDMAAPTFLWVDETAAVLWRIHFDFGDGSEPMERETTGPRFVIGQIDSRAAGTTNELPRLTPEQEAQHTWKPEAKTWEQIKRRSVARAATVTISGYDGRGANDAVSAGRTFIQTSPDPVGAPVFYRDVPLMPSEVERGVIKPLAESNVPLIAWRLRNVSESTSRLLLEGLHTCANCHSFSADGKTMGMDVDGPENDKGTYAMAPVAPKITIRNQDVITWNSFRAKPPGHHTIGFLSQISPDGRFAVTTLNESVYVANFKNYRFLQVFYPTRGILAWHDRQSGRMEALPGADDARYVHTDAVWSPDGKYLVFARAEARDPYPPGRKLAEYAGDPNETPIQYDLYRIPFNGGRGGRAEPIRGASRNGMSNTFPKVSPDGRWIVFVQCRNGQLMRPDSQLYIVSAEGGEPRRMRANTERMNSWHSFSPNGRWLVFSSKSRSPYTQMFLTHLDAGGNDSPPILIEDATAANRAVNIPEFVNIAPDGLTQIDVPAAEYYRLFDSALDLRSKGLYDEAIEEWRRALTLDEDDPKAHNNLGVALIEKGDVAAAQVEFQRALELRPGYAEAHYNLAGVLARVGKLPQAIVEYRRTLEIEPGRAEAHDQLGGALARTGRIDEAIAQFRAAVSIDDRYAEAHDDLGAALLQAGRSAEAVEQFRKALAIDPRRAPAYNNLGVALARSGQLAGAIQAFERALEVKPDYVDADYSLGAIYYAQGRKSDALARWRSAVDSDRSYRPALYRLAWTLATDPDAAVRNGPEALRFADRLVRLGADAESLDAQAAALAEVGRFAEAVEAARQALNAATASGGTELRAELKGRIALYSAGRPYRQHAPRH